MYCRQRAEDGIADARSKRYGHEDCNEQPNYGVEGSKILLFRRPHAEDGVVDVIERC